MKDLSGTRLDQYDLIKPIGKGGMATVYLARQSTMERDVAIKIISPDLATDEEFMARFHREVQIIARLQHPNILPVYDTGQEQGLTFLVMRLMQGGSLAQELKAGGMSTERVIALTKEIGAALDYAHANGIVHRDLKPTNVLLDELGHAYLTDFGIAKLIRSGAATGLTQPGSVMGTPTYMSPEQWRSEPVDGRTDIYALGVILYQMMLGRVPFSAETPHGLMYQHLDALPTPPRLLRPELPPGVDAVIGKALAKDRERRYAAGAELARDLEYALRFPKRMPEQTVFDARPVDPAESDEITASRQPPVRPGTSAHSVPFEPDDSSLFPPVRPEDEPSELRATQPRAAPPPQHTVPSPRSPNVARASRASSPPMHTTSQRSRPASRPPRSAGPERRQVEYSQPSAVIRPDGADTGTGARLPYHYQPPYTPSVSGEYQAPQEYRPRDSQPRMDDAVYHEPGAGLTRFLGIIAMVVIGVAVLFAIVLVIALASSGDDGGGSTGGNDAPSGPVDAPAGVRPSVQIDAISSAEVTVGTAVTIRFTARYETGITRIEMRRLGRVLDAIDVPQITVYTGMFVYRPDTTGQHDLEFVAIGDGISGDPVVVTITAH